MFGTCLIFIGFVYYFKASCSLFGALYSLSELSIVCRGFALSFWALHCLSGLCKVFWGFPRPLGEPPPGPHGGGGGPSAGGPPPRGPSAGGYGGGLWWWLGGNHPARVQTCFYMYIYKYMERKRDRGTDRNIWGEKRRYHMYVFFFLGEGMRYWTS